MASLEFDSVPEVHSDVPLRMNPAPRAKGMFSFWGGGVCVFFWGGGGGGGLDEVVQSMDLEKVRGGRRGFRTRV